jgi:hypothetical protein
MIITRDQLRLPINKTTITTVCKMTCEEKDVHPIAQINRGFAAVLPYRDPKPPGTLWRARVSETYSDPECSASILSVPQAILNVVLGALKRLLTFTSWRALGSSLGPRRVSAKRHFKFATPRRIQTKSRAISRRHCNSCEVKC